MNGNDRENERGTGPTATSGSLAFRTAGKSLLRGATRREDPAACFQAWGRARDRVTQNRRASTGERRPAYDGDESEGERSYEAAAAEIGIIFRLKLATLRRRLPRHEIPHAIRVLVEERKAALKALKERRDWARRGRKLMRQERRTPRPS